ncbi:MAG: T9SS type A sorting domain-containing protein, partial [Patescibacteria group bacterium]|nr:T9SS type A sorting domain-containing protein [Patescibacteria group bacterium]
PNPFNPITTIQYTLPQGTQVNLSIYNILGQEIKSLVRKYETAGVYKVEWNGTNSFGKPVSGGVYLYRLEAGGKVQVRKMVLMK